MHLQQKGSDPRTWSRSSAMLVRRCICSCTEFWENILWKTVSSSLKTSMTWESLRISAWESWKPYSSHSTIHIIISTRESTSGTCVGACSITRDQKKPKKFTTQSSPSSRRLFISSFNKINYHVLIEQLLLYTVCPDEIYRISKGTLDERQRLQDVLFSSCIICKASQKTSKQFSLEFCRLWYS